MGVIRTSRKRNFRVPLRAALLAGAALLAVNVAIPAAISDTTTTTTPQYSPWSGAKAQQLKTLIADLKAKIAAAEQSEAASPDFLADLKALAAKFDALQAASAPAATSSGPAPGTQVFADDFSDGDYVTNPTWKVSAGTWSVDTKGNNHGLTSKIGSTNQKLNLNNVLGSILNQQSTSQSQSDFASIYTPAKLPNAFTLKVTLTSREAHGALNLGVYQGTSGSTLYRMVYQPGGTPGIAIQKVTSNGVTTLGSSSGGYNLEDGQPHDLVLARDASGNMTVTIDGKQAATAKDMSISGDMTGLLFVNSGGVYYLRSVTVTAS